MDILRASLTKVIFLSIMQTQPPSYISGYGERLQLVVFTLFCFFAFTYNLNAVPPYHADENFYTTSTRNMVESDNYLTPIYHDKKRFAKPILFYWLVAASYKTFGINLFSARLVSAFFGTLCIPLVYIIARRMFGGKTPIISAFLLPGCYLHFQISRWAITDMTLNFFILMAFYFFVRGLQDESNQGFPYYLAYLSMGIGFMIKGPPALFFPGLVIGGFILALRDWKKISQVRIGHGILILSVIILPWFITMFSMHGEEFINHILGAELRDRIAHDTPYSFYYFGVVFRYFLPWSLFFIVALAVQLRLISINPVETTKKQSYLSSLTRTLKNRCSELAEKKHQPFLFCLLWVIGPLLLFTFFRIDHSRYMLPISPAIAIITGYFLSQLIDSKNGFKQNIFKIPFFLTGLFYFLIIFLTIVGVYFLSAFFSTPLALIVLSALCFLGLILLFLFYKSRKYFFMIITLGVVQIMILTLVSGEVLPFLNRYPMKSFANQILADPQPNKRIGLYQLGNHRARMGVLTGLPSIYLNNQEELEQFIQSGENIYIVMRNLDWEQKFLNLPMTTEATDTGWRRSNKKKIKISLILKSDIKLNIPKYSENYVLLKAKKKG